MRLAVVSHKECVHDSVGGGYHTDGGFPMQIQALSELFTETRVIVPCISHANLDGLAPVEGQQLSVIALEKLKGRDWSRKVNFVFWLFRNSRIIWNEIRKADGVHTPIPGDVGTIGLLFALLQRKPLFVRHCGNWMVQRTTAERFWKWCMETFAGGRNVMLATGGSDEPPSAKNSQVKWIFSTSLRKKQLENLRPRALPTDGPVRLIIACRQEEKKGTDLVLRSLQIVRKSFPNVMLDVVGSGSLLPKLKALAASLGIDQSVIFHGKVSQAEVLKQLSRAHIFCYPTSASEGFPKVVLEALASGLPVITTRVSVLPQLIGKGCGALIDPSPEELADAVLSLCHDKPKYLQMSTAAIAVARDFTLEKWRDEIAENLSEAWSPLFDVSRAQLLERQSLI